MSKNKLHKRIKKVLDEELKAYLKCFPKNTDTNYKKLTVEEKTDFFKRVVSSIVAEEKEKQSLYYVYNEFMEWLKQDMDGIVKEAVKNL